MDFLREHFYALDFAIGAALPLLMTALYRAGKMDALSWRLFWVGAAIGLTWEVPLSTLDGLGIVDIFVFDTPLPVHFIFIIISHSFWDGGLFMGGVFLVYRLCPAPHFADFSAGELAVLLVWGQAQELGVELLSTGSGGWAYIPAWWNPSLFLFNGRHITLLPQIIWLAAPVAFYLAALRLGRDRMPA